MLFIRVDEDPNPNSFNSRFVKTFRPWPANPGETHLFSLKVLIVNKYIVFLCLWILLI